MQFYAHTKRDKNGNLAPRSEWEELLPHLELTAALTRDFASKFGGGDLGHIAGLWHDIGKATPAYIDYFATGHYKGIRDHATAGAQIVAKGMGGALGQIVANCIAGHHTGLLDEQGAGQSTLMYRLQQKKVTTPGLDLGQIPKAGFPKWLARSPFTVSFFTRMLFSCLIDADRLATEHYLRPSAGPPMPSLDYDHMIALLEDYIATLADPNGSSKAVREVRELARLACQIAALWEPGLFSLTVPTGGGKTLASLDFALRHARRWGKTGVIYAVPFITITDQTARLFREILGPHDVLEHHSNISEETMRSSPLMRLAVENWEAPVTVTTNVQFFESLFTASTNRARKLHNIANKVIVLDEAQMIPVRFLEPCLAALQELTDNYGCTVVLCTATQPSVEYDRNKFRIGLHNVREIVQLRVELFQKLERVSFHNMGYIKTKDLVQSLGRYESSLCIVNTRKQARDLYRLLKPGDDLFHLSTYKCGHHRSADLDRIKERLKAGLPCRVVSTSLIEAGIDVDFPVVYRAVAGVDSIAQAAGRCNRHGLGDLGKVYIFDLDGSSHALRGVFKEAVRVTKEILVAHGRDVDLLCVPLVDRFFRDYYGRISGSWDAKQIMAACRAYSLRSVGQEFRMIEDTEQIVIPYSEEGRALVQELDAAEPTRDLLRRLQRFVVPVYPDMLAKLKARGEIRIIGADDESGIAVLKEESVIYDSQVGLNPW